jgi:hypothetical protein
VSTLLALTALALVALALTWTSVRRRNVLGDVERFQHARHLTTSWAGETPPQRDEDDPTPR